MKVLVIKPINIHRLCWTVFACCVKINFVYRAIDESEKDEPKSKWDDCLLSTGICTGMLLDVEKERFNEKRCEKQIEKATFMDLKMVDANKRKSKEKKSEEKKYRIHCDLNENHYIWINGWDFWEDRSLTTGQWGYRMLHFNGNLNNKIHFKSIILAMAKLMGSYKIERVKR